MHCYRNQSCVVTALISYMVAFARHLFLVLVVILTSQARGDDTGDPPRLTIGNPFSKSTPESKGDTNIADPDDNNEIGTTVPSRKRAYYITCSPMKSGVTTTFDQLTTDRDTSNSFPVTTLWGISVKYFVLFDEEQYIYGSLSNDKGFSDGEPVYVLSRE
jgi:hypothetical protein